MLKKLKEYFDKTPREQVLRDWEETCKKTEGIISPTIGEFLGWQGVVLAERKPFVVQSITINPCTINGLMSPAYDAESFYMGC